MPGKKVLVIGLKSQDEVSLDKLQKDFLQFLNVDKPEIIKGVNTFDLLMELVPTHSNQDILFSGRIPKKIFQQLLHHPWSWEILNKNNVKIGFIKVAEGQIVKIAYRFNGKGKMNWEYTPRKKKTSYYCCKTG